MNSNNYQNFECSVIGAIVIHPEKTMPIAMSKLVADDFYMPEFRTIFKAFVDLFTSNMPIDAITVLGKLPNKDDYKVIIIRAAETVPSISNFEFYVDLVKDASRKRVALEYCNELQGFLINGEDIGELQDVANKIAESLVTTDNKKTVTAKQGIYDFYCTKMQVKQYMKTGIKRLDKYTYIDKGDYIIVGARPSTGKTALTLQIAMKMSEAMNVVYFSLETSASKLYDRMVANYTKTPLSEIKTGEVKDWVKIAESSDMFGNLKLTVVEAAGWTVAQIRATAMQLKADIIFIDYLGLIKSDGKSRYEKATNTSIDLHIMAQSTKITVVALSQLNREEKGEPTATNLRESGQLEQDADIIVMLHVKDEDDTDREIIIAKNKEGNVGKFKLAFDGETQTFTDMQAYEYSGNY